MEIVIDLKKEDWRCYQSYMEKALRKRQQGWRDSLGVNLLLSMIAGMAFMYLFQAFSHFHWPTAIAVAALFVLLFALFYLDMLRIRNACEPLESGTFCGTHRFTFSEHGVTTEGNGYSSHHSWEAVKKIDRASGMILIFLDRVYAFVFPESKLDDPEKLYQRISELHSNATASSNRPPSAAD